MLLAINDLHVRYGNVEVLHGINLHVAEGEIVTILGANGAGKSTTLLCISGLVRPSAGEILFDGLALHRLPAHQVVQARISQSPEGRRVFGTLCHASAGPAYQGNRMNAIVVDGKNSR